MKEITMNNPRVLIYNPDKLEYIVGYFGTVSCEPQFETFDFLDGSSTTIAHSSTFNMQVDNSECLSNITLDPTTMKRIAVYNKEQECKRLDEIIKEKKKSIEELDDIISDRCKRVNKLKEFVANLYNIDVTDDDDYEDYDW